MFSAVVLPVVVERPRLCWLGGPCRTTTPASCRSALLARRATVACRPGWECKGGERDEDAACFFFYFGG
jgi:hypothetical protein